MSIWYLPLMLHARPISSSSFDHYKVSHFCFKAKTTWDSCGTLNWSDKLYILSNKMHRLKYNKTYIIKRFILGTNSYMLRHQVAILMKLNNSRPAVQKLRLIPSTQRRGQRGGKTPLLNIFLYDVSVAAGGHVVPKSCPTNNNKKIPWGWHLGVETCRSWYLI
jgi:hypothetical protein